MALHLVGGDGTILRANRAELDLLGYTAEEYIGRQISDFHADADTIDEMLSRLMAGEKLVRFPARLRARMDRSSMLKSRRAGSFETANFSTRDASRAM
jgi:PAS domain S-box-containing protein